MVNGWPTKQAYLSWYKDSFDKLNRNIKLTHQQVLDYYDDVS